MDTLDPPHHPGSEWPRTTAGMPKDGGNGRNAPDPLSALSEASTEYGRARRQAGPPRRFSGFLLAVLAALLVGSVVAMVGPIDYRCAADFTISPKPNESRLGYYRKELLNYAWHALPPTASDTKPLEWFVESPAQDELRLCIEAPDREAGVARLRELAGGFVKTVEKLDAQSRVTPTETEQLLSSYGNELEKSLDELQSKVDDAVATLPGDDPSNRRHELRAQWDDLRAAFSSARKRVTQSSHDYQRLLTEPEPTHGVVSTEARRQRLEADEGLQQDLAELAVALTEVKAHTLAVWQRADEPLQELVRNTNEFQKTLPDDADTTTTPATRARVAPIADALAAYQARLSGFRDAWTAAFAELREQDIDPYTAGVLDRYGEIRRSLGDFLFTSSKSLSTMRHAVNALNESQADLARDYVLTSKLVRAFHRIQNAHHKFEFVAQDIESTDDFRLDASLKSAQGLHRRTAAKISEIERQIQGEALAQARKRREADQLAAKELMERVRTTADKTVDSLVNLQEELNLSADQSEAFQQATLKVEVAASRLQLTQDYLNETNSRLRDLRAKRLTPADATKVTLQLCHVIGSAVDWRERTRTGGVGAALTLVTVLLGQWWVSKR